MKNIMRTVTRKACYLVIVLAGTALAQNRIADPAPAVTGPAYDLSAGYSYLNMQIPAAGHVHLNGLDVSGTMALGPRWGATVDTNYLRTSDVLGILHPAYMLNAQGGPQFYPFAIRNTRFFVRALAGAALVDGAAPGAGTQFYHGWLLHPSYAVGPGFEHSISEQLALRINGDYLRTSFYDYAGVVRPQNNLRFTVSVLFRLKNRQHASRLN
jgi:hypothetical protein